MVDTSSDEDYEDDDEESLSLRRRKQNWTNEQEELLIELFGDGSYKTWHRPLIRKVNFFHLKSVEFI